MYLRSNEIWKKEVQKARSGSYKGAVEQLNKEHSSKNGWKFVNNVKKGISTGSYHPWDNENNFEYLQFISQQVPVNSSNFLPITSTGSFGVGGFTYEELEECLKKSKSSAGGLDGVTYSMIKSMKGISLRALLTAFNNAVLENNIIQEWKIIKIGFIIFFPIESLSWETL